MNPQYLYLGRESFGRLHHEVKALHHLCCIYKPARKFMGYILFWGKMISFSLFITKATMWVMSNITDKEFTRLFIRHCTKVCCD